MSSARCISAFVLHILIYNKPLSEMDYRTRWMAGLAPEGIFHVRMLLKPPEAQEDS